MRRQSKYAIFLVSLLTAVVTMPVYSCEPAVALFLTIFWEERLIG